MTTQTTPETDPGSGAGSRWPAPAPADAARTPFAERSAGDVLYRRSLRVVVVAQMFGGAGLAAGVTVGALLVQDLLGGERWTGAPSALFTLGSALTALLVGRLSQRAGRRPGLVAGFFAGAVGAAGVVTGVVLHSIGLLFLALFIYGAGTATNLQVRYAATDLVPSHRRATAVSMAMVATTVGAVAGPNSVNLTGRFAASLHLPALTGPFLLAVAAYSAAGLVLLLFLRPDPYLMATAMRSHPSAVGQAPRPAIAARTGAGGINRGVLLGALLMVLSQLAMVAIMTMTPVHMSQHGHSLAQVGFVIGVHISAMFLPSLFTGRLVDRVGRRPATVMSALTLVVAGLVAASADTMAGVVLSLALLGLGWNIGLITGTALIVDSTPMHMQARTQGTVDVLVALAGASGGGLSGMVMAHAGYGTLALGGGLLALALLPAVAWSRPGVEETQVL